MEDLWDVMYRENVPGLGWVPAVWPGFLKSGRPRGPWNVFKSVGGLRTHIFEGFPGPPEPARPQKRTPKKTGQTAFRYPVKVLVENVTVPM